MGCFNMSCAVTNMPIIHGDKMIVAFAAEGDQMQTNIYPVFFEAEYDDYGTFEDPTLDHRYTWFFSFRNTGNTEEESAAVRDAVEDASSVFSLPVSFVSNLRVVYILKSAWDNILHYQRNMCSSSYYYHNPPSWHIIDSYPVMIEMLKAKSRHRQLSAQDSLDEDERQEMFLLTLNNLRTERNVPNLDNAMIDHIIGYCHDNKVDVDDFAKPLAEMFDDARRISSFTNAVNCNLITRYASQDTNDQEQSVLTAIMQDRLRTMRTYWEE